MFESTQRMIKCGLVSWFECSEGLVGFLRGVGGSTSATLFCDVPLVILRCVEALVILVCVEALVILGCVEALVILVCVEALVILCFVEELNVLFDWSLLVVWGIDGLAA
jgi:hypothetical protein